MNSLISSQGRSVEEVSSREIITAIVKRFARLVGMPAALELARKVPRLAVDNDGTVLGYDTRDPIGTITLLIDQYEVHQGETARTKAGQVAKPLSAGADNKFPREVGISDDTSVPMRVLLVDDHVLFREGLVSLLDAQPNMKVVAQAGSINEAVALTGKLRPHLVLLNMKLPDGTGAEGTRVILAEIPETKIVLMTLHGEEDHLFEAIRAGAIGYIARHVSTADFFKTLQGVMLGEAGIFGTTTHRNLDEFTRLSPHHTEKAATLTSREVQVFRELANGASNQEIAQRLVISKNTAKIHVQHVLVKLNFHSRREVAEYARRRFGLSPHPHQ